MRAVVFDAQIVPERTYRELTGNTALSYTGLTGIYAQSYTELTRWALS